MANLTAPATVRPALGRRAPLEWLLADAIHYATALTGRGVRAAKRPAATRAKIAIEPLATKLLPQ